MNSERKRTKKRKDEYTGVNGAEQEVQKPSKDEIAVAKWLRSNISTKKTKFLNHNVECFTASKALDALMLSKFAQGDNPLFSTREIAIEFLDSMLIHKFFHRAKKIPVTEQELKPRSNKKGNNDKEKEKEKEKETMRKDATKENKDTKDEKCTDAESSHVECKSEKLVEKEKKKRKIRLDMHPQQIFVDGPEAYVWIYDPIPMHYWLFGALLVVGAIVICLFPLWPPSLRKGVYYLSIAAAGFLVFILGLAVLRFVVFCIVWALTGSKHHFWLFPNLTEDVGFFASFWPLYKHEYKDGPSTNKKTKKRKRDKDSDAEDETNELILDKEKIDNIKENETGTISDSHDISHIETIDSKITTETSEKVQELSDDDKVRKSSITPSESESEGSQRSSTGKDFEIIDSADVENP